MSFLLRYLLYRGKYVCLFSVSIFSTFCFAQPEPPLSTIVDQYNVNSRLTTPEIESTLIGALNYLKHRQVTQKKYKIKKQDFIIPKLGKNYWLSGLRSSISNSQIVKEKHILGGWPSFVCFQPSVSTAFFQPFLTATDYNLFSTASSAYCLNYFDDQLLLNDKRFVEKMKTGALHAIEIFKRGESYSFWPKQDESGISVNPPNIPIRLMDFRIKIFKTTGLWGVNIYKDANLLNEWILMIYNKSLNKIGGQALFNIPNDSDDTSMALIIKYLLGGHQEDLSSDQNNVALKSLIAFRDSGRKKFDNHNSLSSTGAFLTWHKNENIFVFDESEKGIIPLEVNNIDIVVNANVLLALSLYGLTEAPGYNRTMEMVTKLIENKTWQENILYYPEKLWFPYSLSRFVRNGNIENSELLDQLPKLLNDILTDQIHFEEKHQHLKGVFPAFDSKNYLLSTVLGLNTLLNLGRERAEKIGKEKKYDSLVHHSIKYILRNKIKDKQISRKSNLATYFWKSGPLYSFSIQNLAHWYSNSQMTSMVTEALAKYVMEFDKDSAKSSKLYIAENQGKLNLLEKP